MSLVDVAHQGHAQRLVQRAVGCERVPHAYLFHGPDGVGKEKLALGLAELLLCPAGAERELEGEQANRAGVDRLKVGCGRCEDCRMISVGTHPDLHLIYRQLNRDHPDLDVRKRKALDIGVDVLRHFVIKKVGLTPGRGRAKVFVIREADRITVQAQNALLKTLEEPPGATFLILLVTALDRLLATTQSRCQVVRFDVLPTAFVRTKLAAAFPDLSEEQFEWYARFSDGSAGRALQDAEDGLYVLSQRLLEQLETLGRVKAGRGRGASAAPHELTAVWANESKALGVRYRKRDPEITDTEAGRRALKSIFKLAATWYADVLRSGGGDSSTIVNLSWDEQIREGSVAMGAERAIAAVRRIVQAERQLDLNVNTQLCIETLANDLARLGQGDAIPAG